MTMEYISKWPDFRKTQESAYLRERLRHGALSTFALFLRRDAAPALRVLFCHYVFDDQVKAFEAKIKYLKSIGSFLSVEEAVAVLRGEKSIEKLRFLLTFDDGFRNVVDNAWPVMRE